MKYLVWIFFQVLLIKITTSEIQKRALNVKKCEDQSPVKWMVSIQLHNRHTCNGLVMAKNGILTTAICCKEKLKCVGKGPHYNLTVVHATDVLSDKYLNSSFFPINPNCTITSVSECIIHPNYLKEKGHIEYDACIIKTSESLKNYEEAPFHNEYHNVRDFYEVCTKGTVIGRWYHFDRKNPNYAFECFPVTIKSLKSCAQVTTFVYLRRSNNFTLTCSYDASNRYEVCGAFYGAALMCNDRVIGMVSHKFNFSEQCLQVTPFYYTRMDWVLCFRIQWYNDNHMERIYSIKYRAECGREYKGRSLIDMQDTKSQAQRSSVETILYIPLIVIHLSFILK